MSQDVFDKDIKSSERSNLKAKLVFWKAVALMNLVKEFIFFEGTDKPMYVSETATELLNKAINILQKLKKNRSFQLPVYTALRYCLSDLTDPDLQDHQAVLALDEKLNRLKQKSSIEARILNSRFLLTLGGDSARVSGLRDSSTSESDHEILVLEIWSLLNQVKRNMNDTMPDEIPESLLDELKGIKQSENEFLYLEYKYLLFQLYNFHGKKNQSMAELRVFLQVSVDLKEPIVEVLHLELLEQAIITQNNLIIDAEMAAVENCQSVHFLFLKFFYVCCLDATPSEALSMDMGAFYELLFTKIKEKESNNLNFMYKMSRLVNQLTPLQIEKNPALKSLFLELKRLQPKSPKVLSELAIVAENSGKLEKALGMRESLMSSADLLEVQNLARIIVLMLKLGIMEDAENQLNMLHLMKDNVGESYFHEYASLHYTSIQTYNCPSDLLVPMTAAIDLFVEQGDSTGSHDFFSYCFALDLAFLTELIWFIFTIRKKFSLVGEHSDFDEVIQKALSYFGLYAPFHEDFLVGSAYFQLLKGNKSECLSLCSSLNKVGTNSFVKYIKAHCLLLVGKPQDALSLLETSIPSNDNRHKLEELLILLRAHIHSELGDYCAVKRIISSHTHVLENFQMGELYVLALLKLGDDKQAMQFLQEQKGKLSYVEHGLLSVKILLHQRLVKKAINLISVLINEEKDKENPNQTSFCSLLLAKANIYLTHRNDAASYISCYKDIVERFPVQKNLCLLGQAYVRVGLVDDALKALKLALKKSRFDKSIVEQIGDLLERRHQFDQAIKFYFDVIDENQTGIGKIGGRTKFLFFVKLRLTNLLFKLGRNSQAVKVGKTHSDEPQMLLLLANIYQELGSRKLSVDSLQKARELLVSLVQDKSQRKDDDILELVMTNQELALKLISNSENTSKAVILLEDSIRLSGETKIDKFPTKFQPDIHLTKIHLSTGNLQKVTNLFSLLETSNPVLGKQNYRTLQYLLAWEKNEYSFFEEELTKLGSLDFEDLAVLDKLKFITKVCRVLGPTYIQKVLQFLRLGEDSLAKERNTTFFRRHFIQDIFYLYGKCFKYNNEFVKSVEYFNLAKSRTRYAAKSLLQMINVYLNVEGVPLFNTKDEHYLEESEDDSIATNLETASQLYAEYKSLVAVSDVSDDSCKLIESKIRIVRHSKIDLEEAVKYLVSIIEVTDEIDLKAKVCLEALYLLSLALILLKEFPKARTQLKRLLKLRTNNCYKEIFEKANILLAKLFIHTGKLDLAERILMSEVIRRNPSSAAAYQTLGSLKEKEGLYHQTIEHYRKSFALSNKNNIVTGLKLGVALLHNQEYFEAIDVGYALKARFPGFVRVEEEIIEKAKTLIRF
eukprot:snap_masked-scaffold_1-processed-gene-20.51-mRNA-1 protein AED:1.00 eAED:1.00 QI:0/0/0/0/1/1/3/0/1352